MQDYEKHFKQAQIFFDVANGDLPVNMASLGAWLPRELNYFPSLDACYKVDLFGYVLTEYIDNLDTNVWSGNVFFGATEEAIREFFNLISIIEEEKGERLLANLQAYHHES
jgi:hypothetical protein